MVEYVTKCSFLEIYNEKIFDLLDADTSTALGLRVNREKGVFVEGLTEAPVATAAEAAECMARGSRNRTVGSTLMNRESSRSHSVFTLIIERRETIQIGGSAGAGSSQGKGRAGPATGRAAGKGAGAATAAGAKKRRASMAGGRGGKRRMSVAGGKGPAGSSSSSSSSGATTLVRSRRARFHLIDLAGSERQSRTGASGDRLVEAGNINKSLSALGNVIHALVTRAQGKSAHVAYRDSKLTHLLKDSLGGNSKTVLVAAVSPADDSLGETLSTLNFAARAKQVRNRALVNEDTKGTVVELQKEVRKLRAQLQAARAGIAVMPPAGVAKAGAGGGAAAGAAGGASAIGAGTGAWASLVRLHHLEGAIRRAVGAGAGAGAQQGAGPVSIPAAVASSLLAAISEGDGQGVESTGGMEGASAEAAAWSALQRAASWASAAPET